MKSSPKGTPKGTPQRELTGGEAEPFHVQEDESISHSSQLSRDPLGGGHTQGREAEKWKKIGSLLCDQNWDNPD